MEGVSSSLVQGCAQSRVSPEIYTRLLRVLFSLILKTSGVADCTASLGNLLQGLSPERQGFPYTQSLFFQFIPVASHSPAMYHCEKLRHIFLMTDLLVITGRLLLSPPEASLLHAEKTTSLSFFSQDKCTSSLPSWWQSAELAQVYPCLSCTEGPTAGCHVPGER